MTTNLFREHLLLFPGGLQFHVQFLGLLFVGLALLHSGMELVLGADKVAPRLLQHLLLIHQLLLVARGPLPHRLQLSLGGGGIHRQVKMTVDLSSACGVGFCFMVVHG